MLSQKTLFVLILGMIVLLTTLALGQAGWMAQIHDYQAQIQTQLMHVTRAVAQQGWIAGLGLIWISFAYGVLHAIGPGHGKAVISGFAAVEDIDKRRLFFISMLSALLQSLVAIILVYGTMGLFALSAKLSVQVAERWLTPLSYSMIAVLGGWLVLRCLRKGKSLLGHNPHAHDDCGCGHHHKSTPMKGLGLVMAIGIRPCTGAILILAMAWKLQIPVAGGLAVLVMALGTGLTVTAVSLGVLSLKTWMQGRKNHWLAWGGVVAGGCAGLVISVIGVSLALDAVMKPVNPLMGI